MSENNNFVFVNNHNGKILETANFKKIDARRWSCDVLLFFFFCTTFQHSSNDYFVSAWATGPFSQSSYNLGTLTSEPNIRYVFGIRHTTEYSLRQNIMYRNIFGKDYPEFMWSQSLHLPINLETNMSFKLLTDI